MATPCNSGHKRKLDNTSKKNFALKHSNSIIVFKNNLTALSFRETWGEMLSQVLPAHADVNSDHITIFVSAQLDSVLICLGSENALMLA